MSFWHAFILLAVFIPLAILWITCIFDVVLRRHDLSGWARAAWVALIIFLPAVGSLAYIAFGGLTPTHVSDASAVSPRDDALRMTGRTP
jgi:Phospholipase_D-nuclease N-terminal